MRKKECRHTIRLTIDDDGVYIRRSRELWSMYLSPAQLFVIVVNLAAILLSLRYVYNEIALDFNTGVYVIVERIFAFIRGPIVGYAPG